MSTDMKDKIPGQHEGAQITAKSVATLNNPGEAEMLFRSAKEKLLQVNQWRDIAKGLSAEFRLIDASGKAIAETPQKGYYFKIDIPGPGSAAGKGYDWVQIEDIETKENGDEESIVITVRPSSDPTSDNNETAHFYSEKSTSSFVVYRKGSTVTAAILDRNTKPNTENVELKDKLRNALVGAGGILAFSKLQWQNLTDGLLQPQ
jgi:hypothetical protein